MGRMLPAALLLSELGLASAMALALAGQDLDVVCQAVDQSDGAGRFEKGGVPMLEGQVGDDEQRAVLVAVADELKEQIGGGAEEGGVTGEDDFLNVSWLHRTTTVQLQFVLGQYRSFVERFPCWLALTIAFAADARVRELLAPNLVSELGGSDGPSHLMLLDRCLDKCGVDLDLGCKPLASTRVCEDWFFTLFSSGDTHASLCALGPATERISWRFLEPLQEAVRTRFDLNHEDIEYFDVHRPEVEDEHAANLDEAIRIIEAASCDDTIELAERRRRLTAATISQHHAFWTGCRLAAERR